MEVALAGHVYKIDQYDGDGKQIENITFMMRNDPKEKYPGNEYAFKGTNCKEVLRVLIDRINYLQALLDDEQYTGRAILRMSTIGRGFRLHETKLPGHQSQ